VSVQESYSDLVASMRDLGKALIPATAAQYDAPPRARSTKEAVSESKGIRNPTLETVLDARRLALSDEIGATATALRQARALLDPHRAALRQAVAVWEDQEGVTA
jgi:hypothetical protein